MNSIKNPTGKNPLHQSTAAKRVSSFRQEGVGKSVLPVAVGQTLIAVFQSITKPRHKGLMMGLEGACASV